MLYSSPTADQQGVDMAISRLLAARSTAIDWLVDHIADNGEPVGAAEANWWYRLPWALVMSGRQVEAAAVMSWIEREALDDRGDLRPGAHQTPWTVEAAPYPIAIIAAGAWHLEHYGTAGALMDVLRNFQDPDTGGAYVERPEHRSTGRQDLLCTAQLGMTALVSGRTDVAGAAFEWVERLWTAQPAVPERLYLSWDGAGLITDFADDVAFGRVVDFSQGRQAFFNPGIGAAFLGRYYQATRNDRAREIGRGLLELSAGGTKLQYEFPDTIHVGKFAWGASVMLESDPTEDHLLEVLSMADWCVDSQLEDGSWNPSGFLVPEPMDPDTLWKTGEHVMIINMMLAALGGWSSSKSAT